jgi:hydrogenase maturation protease
MSGDPRKKTLVIGLGNPLRGDDGFGTRVLESLAHQGAEFLREIALVDAHTDLLSQIESFQAFERVLLVDAILDPEGKLGEAGRIAVFEQEMLLSLPETSTGAHQISPLLAVKLFRSLHPEALTEFVLVGLLVDQVDRTPHYATDSKIQEGALVVRNFLL